VEAEAVYGGEAVVVRWVGAQGPRFANVYR